LVSTKVFVFWSLTALCLALPLAAEPITYTMTGTLSGSLGVTDFSGAAFTIVLDGDTANITEAGALFNGATSTSISIAGFGSGDFTEGIDAATAGGIAGLLNLSGTDGILIENLGFAGWDLATSLGPLEETGAAYLDTVSFDTSLGTLTITDAENVSFGASTSTVPEPATVGLVALSLFGIALRRRWARE
jgi:hypothetical protein